MLSGGNDEARTMMSDAAQTQDVADALVQLPVADQARVLQALPTHATAELLTLLAAEERAAAEKLLAYPVDSVGRLMTTEYVAIRAEWTIQHVLNHVRDYGRDSETLNVLYVIDDAGVVGGRLRRRAEGGELPRRRRGPADLEDRAVRDYARRAADDARRVRRAQEARPEGDLVPRRQRAPDPRGLAAPRAVHEPG